MESRFSPQDNKDSGINEKLDKLAEDVKKLPEDRAERLQELMGKDSYSIKEIAEVLGVDYHSIRRAVAKGTLKSFKVGPKTIRIPRSELEKYVQGKRAVSVAEAATILGVAPLTIRRHIDNGKIKAFRFTKRGPWLIDEAEIQRIMSVEGEQAL